ncbi:DUF2255 family protein [Nonomuraea pusilla]|uniref:DUF2255 family protein n=1 Tax=Nonomuraea pusilla TaxID=46177 RepID=A0A1H7HZY9_9ACTN|nr:DUF2255 family protein [Nonomuraea pusilla]SEK55187.1 hypothetical protein SAMN05660976_00626 [Nonomuraea pusilla]
MANWTESELERLAAAEELEIAPRNDDGSLRAATTIWVVRVGGDLYVRSWRGEAGSWFRAARRTREGHVSADGVEKDVRLLDAGDEVGAAVDDAYRSKYQRYAGSYLEPMLEPRARSATLRLVPDETGTAPRA